MRQQTPNLVGLFCCGLRLFGELFRHSGRSRRLRLARHAPPQVRSLFQGVRRYLGILVPR
jgi:hypothetical protein